jgi:hypothetical protein
VIVTVAGNLAISGKWTKNVKIAKKNSSASRQEREKKKEKSAIEQKY